MINEFAKIAEKVTNNLKSILESEGINATGGLSDSINYRVTLNSITIEINAYGEYLDKGSKPHWAPIAPLKDWVKAKGLSINPYAVRASIAKKGTKAHPWIYKFKETMMNLDKDMLNVLGIEVDKFDKQFKKTWQ